MANPTPALLHGDALCSAISAEMIAFHEHHHGRAPGTVRTEPMGDDLVACLLGGIYTQIEKTMIELEQSAVVHETRRSFQHAMRQRFIASVEGLSGRRVIGFDCSHHVGPDLEMKLFILEPAPEGPPDRNQPGHDKSQGEQA